MVDQAGTTILLTGATGFIGSHLLPALGSAGHRVVTCGRSATRVPGQRHITADLAGTDGSAGAGDGLARRLERVPGADLVLVHLAGEYDGAVSWPDLYRANVAPLGYLLEAMAPRLRHTVFLSSVAVYGGPAVPTRESPGGPYGGPAVSAPESPDGPYGRSKLLAEQLLGLYRASTGRPAGVLRCASVYGAGNPGRNAVGKLATAIAAQRPFRIDPAAEGRDYIHVSDVVAALEQAVASRFDGCVDVGTGVSTTPSELVEIARGAGFLVRTEGDASVAGPSQPRFRCATRLAAEALGFRARVSLPDGVLREVRWRCGSG